MSENEMWQVEEIEAISFDENGKEDGTWRGHAVTKIDDPVNYCFECRDKLNADTLCEFLNNECYININDTSIEDFVIDNCIEWENIVSELSTKERQFYHLKKEYQIKSDKLLDDARKVKDETGFSQRAWFKDLIEYGETQGYPHSVYSGKGLKKRVAHV